VQVEAEFVDGRGRHVTVPVSRLADEPLEERAPVWQPAAYRGRVAIATWWWAASTGKLVGCSSLERQRAAVELDFDRGVTCFSSWPVQLSWTGLDGVERTVVADFVARNGAARELVVCPPGNHLTRGTGSGPGWPEVQEMLDRACGQAGWRLRVPQPASAVRAANLLRAAQFRHPRHHDTAAARTLLAAFARPRPLQEGVAAAGLPQACALARTYHLLWRQWLRFDWETPLLPTSTVAACGGPR